MSIYECDLYMEDIQNVTGMSFPWSNLKNASILISGSTGLLGSFLIDVIMEKNIGCTIYALGRSKEKAFNRFTKWMLDDNFHFIQHDVCSPIVIDGVQKIDYVIHLASNTHPIQYSLEPIETIATNIFGLKNMLDFAVDHNASQFMFASSNEIYGENRGDVEFFDEKYCGYLDSNTLRAAYPESKRCGEALCQAYMSEKGLNVVIPRFTRSYGPTMLLSDSKAISQFLKNALKREDIVLKSLGNQYYSYTYMADAVLGLLTIMFKGKCGEAYNIADQKSNIKLKDLAILISSYVGKDVVFDDPNPIEKKGFSKASKALLDGDKLKKLGWEPLYSIETGIHRTIDIMNYLYK